uniref:uncharacterized protein LOC108950288 isoform X1 n=1 Tax=Ciona intestinalis TaxID=7719 RepID=UPI000EF52603|nr:uncharacterized protein LOC108950288 isoform X1 [Ciona intestinalis]XP_026694332.1 uncharacterized protein LOC108950288 isoform X1 [Ciona intestinalis]|eukprot:XP_026694331.1 uncharacterized protein LOC108950288 isoform X1 [Ciona intestinalis]
MTIVRIWIAVSLVALATSQNTGFSPAVPTPNVDGDWLVWTAGRYTPFTPLLTESVINNASLDSTFFSDVTEVRSNVIHRGGIGTQYWSIATNHRRGLYYYLDLLSNNIGVYDVTNGTRSRGSEGISWSADGVAVDWLTGTPTSSILTWGCWW